MMLVNVVTPKGGGAVAWNVCRSMSHPPILSSWLTMCWRGEKRGRTCIRFSCYFVCMYDANSKQCVCVCVIGFLQMCINQIWLFTSGDRPLTSPSERSDSVSNLRPRLNQFVTSTVSWTTGARHNATIASSDIYNLSKCSVIRISPRAMGLYLENNFIFLLVTDIVFKLL